MPISYVVKGYAWEYNDEIHEREGGFIQAIYPASFMKLKKMPLRATILSDLSDECQFDE